VARHVDFDEAWESLSGGSQAAPTIKVHGQEVTLPADVPVALVLLGRQLSDPEERRTVTLGRVLEVLGIVYGAEVVDRWVAEGMGRDQAIVLLLTTQGMWAKDDPAGEA
jgi:hypothetical protein